jgi:hypothetical protein
MRRYSTGWSLKQRAILQADDDLNSVLSTFLNPVFKLILVVGAIEMALRLDDESIFSDPPHFEAADTNLVARTAGACAGADPCPVVFHAVDFNKEVIQKHLQIWKAGHESLRPSVMALRPTAGAPPFTLSQPSGE